MAKRNVRAVAERLIKQHRPGMVKPEVLCIGPQKTGTTWLYANLRRHPQIWVPPVKELNFLAQGHSIPHHSINQVLFGSHWFYQNVRRQLKEKIQRGFSSRYPKRLFDGPLQWLLNYAFGKRSYEWYAGLFPVTPKLCIDISPSYYDLPEERIREHKAYNPSTKIIILVRNPIDRVWSRARMVLGKHRGRSVDQIEQAEFIHLFDTTYQSWRPYSQTIALWQSYFDDVCVEFYDRLNESPLTFFRNICTFLGIDATAVTEKLDQRVHEGLLAPLPVAFRQYLYDQYAPEMNALADSGMVYARRWLDEHHTIIKREMEKNNAFFAGVGQVLNIN